MISLKVDGLRDLGDQLKELFPALKARKVVQSAVRKAMKPVLAAAQASVPVDTGLLRSSLRIGTAKDGDKMFAAGLLIGTGKGGSKKEIANAAKAAEGGSKGKHAARKLAQRKSAHWRWHFVERGVPAHGIAAKPFLRPAMDKNAQAALDSIMKDMNAAVKRELKKRAKKAAKK